MSNRLRLFSLFNFIFQALRIPTALYLCSSNTDLETYFLVVGSSIPAQFLASEVLLYRGINLRNITIGEKATFGIFILSCFFMALKYNVLVGFIYVIYSFSILAYSFYSKKLRIVYGPSYLIAADAIYNFVLTVQIVSACFYFRGYLLSWAILVITVLFTSLYCLFIYMNTQKINGYSDPVVHESSHGRAYNFQLGIMLSTQLERILIGTIWPLFLGCISMAAAICQGWRRIVLDDAVLYEKLRIADDRFSVSRSAFFYYFKYSLPLLFLVFLTALAQAFKVNYGIQYFDILFKKDVFVFMVPLLIIYMAALPSGIIGINIIRGGWSSPFYSFIYLIFVILILLILLTLTMLFGLKLNESYIWYIICLTVGVNVFLFLDSVNFIKCKDIKLFLYSFLFYYLICGFVIWIIL